VLHIKNNPTKQRDIAEIVCNCGHEFKRSLQQLKRNSKCPVCAKSERAKKEEERVTAELDEYGFEYISGYTNKKSSIVFKCKQCGAEKELKYESLMKYKKCAECGYKYGKDVKKRSSKTIFEIASENDIEIIDFVKGKESISIFKCSSGHIFERKNKYFRNRPECKECKNNKKYMHRHEMYLERLNRHGLDVVGSTLIKDNTTRFKYICKKGHVCSSTIMNLHPDYKCATCSGEKLSLERRLSIDEVIEKLSDVGVRYISGEYKNNRSIIECECEKEGHSIRKSFMEIYATNKGCVECRYAKASSSKEDRLFEFVKSLEPDAEQGNRKILGGKEIDIYIPSKKIGIEFDGIYWHSDLVKNEPKYHLSKTLEAQSRGIKLIHIFESEFDNKEKIVFDMIKVKLGHGRRIYARKTEIRTVGKDDEKKFFNENHLQGFANSSVCYGLYYDGELVMAMSFAKNRFSNNTDFELIRMASKDDMVVVGGMSKILKHFDRIFDRPSITSYCNIRFSGADYGNTGYAKNGFVLDSVSKPNYFYFKVGDETTLYSRQKFQKHKLRSKLEIFDETKTEVENMHMNGYGRIFDCGNAVFVRI